MSVTCSAGKIIALLASFKGALTRPIIAVGYSGGFVPLVEGTTRTKTQVESFVSLAGIISGIGAVGTEAVNLIVQAADKIQHGIVTGLEGLLNALFKKIPIVGDVVNTITSILDFITKNTLDQAFLVFKNALSELGKKCPPALPTVLPSSTDVLINLWGDKDILYDLNLVGERQEVSGFTPNGQIGPDGKPTKQLFNIEILGVDHFDYIKGIDPSRQNNPWNVAVSDFVTRMLIASKTPEDLKGFLDSQPGIVTFDGSKYTVSLPGHP